MSDSKPDSDQDHEQSTDSSSSKSTTAPKKLTFFQMFFSTIRALLGVQSKENLERDFAQGSATNFIVIGLILVAIFIFTLVEVVSIVLDNSGL